MTEHAKQKVKENRILFVRILANMTNIFQPLDLTVNGSFKSLMKSKFTEYTVHSFFFDKHKAYKHT